MSCEGQKEEQGKTEETSVATTTTTPCEGTERIETAPAVPAAVCSTPEEAAANAHLKLIITNLGFKCDVSRLERMLREANIEYVRAKKVFGAVCGSVWFANEAQKEEAKRRLPEVLSPYSKVAGDKIQVLECESVNRHRLERIHRQAKRARTSEGDTSPHSAAAAAHQQEQENEGDQGEGKARGPVDVNDVVAALHRLPYEKQLEEKAGKVRSTFAAIMSKLRKQRCPLPRRYIEFADGGRVKASPVTRGYRNKLAFTVGTDAAGVRCVGFSEGSFGDGHLHVVRPTGCVLVSARMEAIRAAFEAFVQRSPRDVYDKKTHRGFYRQLELREFTTGDTLAVVQVNSTGVAADALDAEVAAFARLLADDLHVTSAFVQYHAGVSNYSEAAPLPLFGPHYVSEQVLGLRFRVSPGSFFQTNTRGMEVLYGTVRDWCNKLVADDDARAAKAAEAGTTASATEATTTTTTQKKRRIVLFDVCCGTGTIGQILAKECFQEGENEVEIVGIDICEEAIRDAEQNFAENAAAITAGGTRACTVQYVAGKAEEHMRALSERSTASAAGPCTVFAVVDPPRGGLHPSVIRALRMCRPLTHLIYVSCSPGSLANDAEVLCRPESKTTRGMPFHPVQGVGVDMFPHTEHLEMVMLFTRRDVFERHLAEDSSADAPQVSSVATASAPSEATTATPAETPASAPATETVQE